MTLTAASIIVFMSVSLVALARGEKAVIEELDLKSTDVEMPQAIKTRREMTELIMPETYEAWKQLGMEKLLSGDDNIGSMIKVYRAWDGLVFLVDSGHMSLWVKEGEVWKCVVEHIHINKTFGGNLPVMPVSYLGENLFAVSQTISGDVAENSKDGFPQARAVTFLINSKNGKVLERSKSFIYDHTPPLVISEEWVTKYKIKN